MESDCSDDSPECWCPCGCGCQNDKNGQDLPFYKRVGSSEIVPVGELGMCASCAEGNHETPSGVSVFALIAAHKSIIKHLRRYVKAHGIKSGEDKYGEKLP